MYDTHIHTCSSHDSEQTFDMDKADKYINMIDSDIVLGSVHPFDAQGKLVRFSRDDLSENALSQDELCKYVEAYYNEILNVASKSDIDVLCHLTYPIRYTNKKYNRNVNIYEFSNIITQILKTICINL